MRKTDELMKIAQEIGHQELLLLYYIRKTEKFSVSRLLGMVRKVYRAQCGFENEFFEKKVQEDLMQVGICKGLRTKSAKDGEHV